MRQHVAFSQHYIITSRDADWCINYDKGLVDTSRNGQSFLQCFGSIHMHTRHQQWGHDEQKQRTIVEWWRTCDKGEKDCGCTEWDRLPTEFQRHSGNRTSRPVEDDQRPPRTSLTLFYIGNLFKTIRRILGPLDIKVTFHPHSSLRHQLICPKDPVPMGQRTGVVYQNSCSDCPSCMLDSLAEP